METEFSIFKTNQSDILKIIAQSMIFGLKISNK